MVRHSAENQRRLREKKKEEDDKWLEKEAARVSKYYTPSSKLSAEKRKERNVKSRVRMQKRRAAEKEMELQIRKQLEQEKARKAQEDEPIVVVESVSIVCSL